MEIKNSKRLSYALMGSDDADLLFELDQDIEVMRYINGGEMTSMQDIHHVFLPRMAIGNWVGDSNVNLGVMAMAQKQHSTSCWL